MKKRLKSYLSLFFASLLLITTLLVPVQLTSAADSNAGSMATAVNKLWYRALKTCIGTISYWYQPSLNDDDFFMWASGSMEISDLHAGRWFATNDQLELTGGNVGIVWGGGAYVEHEVTGSYSDGKIYCGENDNNLVKLGLNSLGLSYLDVLCNYSDGYFSSGVLYVDTDKISCSTKYADTDGEWAYWNTERESYFNDVVTNKTFSGKVPGGSLDKLTYLEEYYIRLLTFQNACAADSGNFGHTMDYTIVGWNPNYTNKDGSKGRFERVGYSQKNSGSHSVYYWGGNSATCQELADSLDVGSNYFTAYRDEILEPVKQGCIDAYNEARDEVGLYRTKYILARDAADNFARNVKNMLDALDNNRFPTSDVAVKINGPSDYQAAQLASPVTQSFKEKINGYLQTALAGVDGNKIFSDNAFTQLKAAVDSIIASSEIGDNGTVISVAPEEDRTQAREWLSKVEVEITRATQNITKLTSFISDTSTDKVTPWAYEDDEEINIVCPGLESLKNLKDSTLADFEGIPDIDGEFHQTDFIDPDIDNSAVQTDPCYTAGLESMSWILCPTLNNTARTAGFLDGMIDKMLSTEKNLYDGTSKAHDVWEVIRNIANALMIIFLLVVIASQLTGYGIDNYGIKKMLPKLILVAVLVNLSFLICQLAIDLSNILGSGLNTLFQNIAGNTSYSGEEFFSQVITILLGGTIAGGAIAFTVMEAASAGGGMMVVILVLAVLTVVVAVLIFFIMLGARTLIVIIGAAISPLAFVCYALPNTQNLFKKWWNIFKTALVMYPICGAVYGLSTVIRSIVFSSNNGIHLWMGIIAVIAPFLPFFILPTLLKGALAGLGKIGGALTAMGGALRSSTKRGTEAIQNTNAYKDRLQFAKDQTAAARAQRIHDRLSGQTNLNARQQDRLRRADETILARNKRLAENERRTTGDYFNAMLEKQGIEGAAEDSAIARYSDPNYRAAAEAGIESKAIAAAIADQEALLTSGKAAYTENDKSIAVNTNSAESIGKYHAQALATYRDAKRSGDLAKANTAMAQVKAAQNLLSKTDDGRRQVFQNLSAALRSGETTGLGDAASHLMSDFGDKYKSVNRGAHAMIADLSTGNLEDSSVLSSLQAKLDYTDAAGAFHSGAYSMAGTGKYTPESLAGADDLALDNLAKSVENGSLVGDDLLNLQSTVTKALEMKEAGHLNIKPAVEEYLRRMVEQTHLHQNIVNQQNIQQAATQAAQQQFDSITRNLDEINQQLHQHNNGPQNNP